VLSEVVRSPRTELERGARIAAGVLALFAFERLAALALAAVRVAFPSSVAAMLGCFAVMLGLRGFAPAGAERLSAALSPALRFLSRWMAIFFVPPLVLLPLTPVPPAGTALSVALVVVGGVPVTALFTGWLASRLGAPEVSATPVTSPGREWPRRWVVSLWALILLASVAAWQWAHAAPARAGLGVALAVLGFVLGEAVREHLSARVRGPLSAFLHPVLVSGVIAYYGFCGLGFAPAQFLEPGASPGRLLMAMLSPSVAALGFALDRERNLLRQGAIVLCLTTLASAAFSLFATALCVRLLGVHEPYARALLPRSVTTPVALAIASELHANPGLTAVFVITSGVLGALFAPALLRRAGLASSFTLGVATGASCHGIGTAALVRDEPAAAAVSGISFALTAAMSVALVSVPSVRAALLALLNH